MLILCEINFLDNINKAKKNPMCESTFRRLLMRSCARSLSRLITKDASKLATKFFENNQARDVENYIYLLKSELSKCDIKMKNSKLKFFLKTMNKKNDEEEFKRLYDLEYKDYHAKLKDTIQLRFKNDYYRHSFVYETRLFKSINSSKDSFEVKKILELRRQAYIEIYDYYCNNSPLFRKNISIYKNIDS